MLKGGQDGATDEWNSDSECSNVDYSTLNIPDCGDFEKKNLYDLKNPLRFLYRVSSLKTRLKNGKVDGQGIDLRL